MQEIEIPIPDDYHIHLRDDDALKLTVPHAANQFARVTVMPNLKPAIDSTDAALSYLRRIEQYIPNNLKHRFQPLLTLYLTSNINSDEVIKASKAGIKAIKLYPQGATTNSSQGIRDIQEFDDVFSTMSKHNMLLLVHGEVADQQVDIFAREKKFIQNILSPLIKRHPKLKIVMEHITTKVAVEFCLQSSKNIGATITPQHLLINRNHLLSGGIKPHYYCLPILKREKDRKALLQAATSGNAKFFLGTDSAPHATNTKENACGCAGCYSAPYAIEYYAQAFDSVNKLNKLADFSSKFGAEFYRLNQNSEAIKLIQQPTSIAKDFPYLDNSITPLMAGETLGWQRIDS